MLEIISWVRAICLICVKLTDCTLIMTFRTVHCISVVPSKSNCRAIIFCEYFLQELATFCGCIPSIFCIIQISYQFIAAKQNATLYENRGQNYMMLRKRHKDKRIHLPKDAYADQDSLTEQKKMIRVGERKCNDSIDIYLWAPSSTQTSLKFIKIFCCTKLNSTPNRQIIIRYVVHCNKI